MQRPEGAGAQRRERAPRLRDLARVSLGASPNDTVFSVSRQWALILAAGGFMTLVGPLGTEHASLLTRLAYWIGLMLAGTVLANLVARLALGTELFERRPWVWAVLVTLLITPPQTVVVWAASGMVFMGGLRPRLLLLDVLPVLIVSMAMLALTVLTQRKPALTHATADGAVEAAFARRLPPKLRGAELLAVQAEDHYLRLHTSRGQDIILMRLADALAELEGLEGAQVHRSWWVARDAVVGAQRGAGRASLTLKNGAVAPVSRTYARALRDAGWY